MKKTVLTNISENGRNYKVRSSIVDTSLSCIIIDVSNHEINVYKTPKILEQNLKAQAQKFGIDLVQYFTKLIFFLENPSNAKFNITKNNLTINEILNSNIQAKYFQVDLIELELENVPFFIGNLIEELHIENTVSENKNNILSDECNSLKVEVVEYKNKLIELVERKKVDDALMLTNFVSLLNEKKTKIQHLLELLEAFKIDPSLANPAKVNVNFNKKKRGIDEVILVQPKAEVSDSDCISNEDIETDGEKDGIQNKVEVEEKTIANAYVDDIFDEAPMKIEAPLPKRDDDFTNMPSTSSGINSKQPVVKERIDMKLYESVDVPMKQINTQDWLDSL